MQGDAALLRQLLLNLFGNGAEVPPRGRRPRWSGSAPHRDGDGWEIAVADNGIGIEPEYAEKVFVIFQRLHGRERYAGTGIGLALAKKIVEFHGGRIWLDTDRRRPGTDIRFTLPRRRQRHGPARGDRMTDSPRPAIINVLLVEDDPGDVLMTREAFDEYLHNRLDVVTDGAAALAYLRARSPVRRRAPARPRSCSTSTCPAATAARCCRRSRTTPTCGTSR